MNTIDINVKYETFLGEAVLTLWILRLGLKHKEPALANNHPIGQQMR